MYSIIRNLTIYEVDYPIGIGKILSDKILHPSHNRITDFELNKPVTEIDLIAINYYTVNYEDNITAYTIEAKRNNKRITKSIENQVKKETWRFLTLIIENGLICDKYSLKCYKLPSYNKASVIGGVIMGIIESRLEKMLEEKGFIKILENWQPLIYAIREDNEIYVHLNGKNESSIMSIGRISYKDIW